MKLLLCIICATLSACGPIVVNLNKRVIAEQVAQSLDEVGYLSTIPVIYVDGMPRCGGLANPESVVLGCFYPSGGYIEIATIDFRYHDSRAFRYDDQMEATLAHEYIHALQWRRCATTWHPVERVFTCPK